MADVLTDEPVTPDDQSGQPQLEGGTYEIIRNRLQNHSEELRRRLEILNDNRREVFGSIETRLISTERVTTEHNCVARDIVTVGDRFIFGYNVQFGLKSEIHLKDVFGIFRYDEGKFHEEPLDLINDSTFESEFQQVYKYYKSASFAKFQQVGAHLYMVFRVGKSTRDIKAFKWLIEGDSLRYLDNRSDHEVVFPPQHEFEWTRTHRDLHRTGQHPHISIEDRLFVETVGGDLTIKIEDNTEDGEGIYSEPVDDPDQVLDDAEIFYAIVGNLILLKMRPYQEKDFRYLLYNEKTQQARRLDTIANACVLLPEDHGLIFSNGYYLQTGECKIFESDLTDLLFEERISSPNGEDYLYTFYNRESGDHVLLSYNMIEQKVDTPINCNGFATFEDGQMLLFRSDASPQKHHALQLWQTPYVGVDYQAHAKTDSYLYKIGNKDIVRAMAESYEVIGLIHKEDTYANLYVDLLKKSTDLLDAYFWLGSDDAGNLKETIRHIADAAKSAVDEFDKVVRVRKATEDQFRATSKDARQIISSAASRMFQQIDDFVKSLADLRRVRGEVISLRDLKYVDLDGVAALEQEIEENSGRISRRCVEFLLRDDSLQPYEKRVEEQRSSIEHLEKVTEARKLDEQLSEGSSELEMLIDIVSNLKIEDATERTRIIDNISAIYAKLNQARAALKKKNQELLSVEGVAEFNSQMKLLSQAVVNYLDVCDSPERCDEYLTKMMVQVEELEGRFAEFDEFIVQLTEKREEIYAAFDAKKLALVEARNKRATALMSAAERILKGIETRVNQFDSINEINSYFAGDLMIDKVRDIVDQLKELEDSVKVDDIQSRMKTIREDAVRQLKDRQELFVDGENIIRLGKHKFSVNVQPLDLTTVLKDGEMAFHLTGTNFLEKVENEEFLATRDVWDQEVVSENRNVYRGEYLAYLLFHQVTRARDGEAASLLEEDDDALVAYVQRFMGPRYREGYVKGVHDHDAAVILRALLDLDRSIGRMRYFVDARALATLFWCDLGDTPMRDNLIARYRGLGTVSELFPRAGGRGKHVDDLEGRVASFVDQVGLFDHSLVRQASEFLFEEIAEGGHRSVSHQAMQLCRNFEAQIERRNFTEKYQESLARLSDDQVARFQLLTDWLNAFVDEHDEEGDREFINEAAATLLEGAHDQHHVLHVDATRNLTGLLGNHPRVKDNIYRLDFNNFSLRLEEYQRTVVPAFDSYTKMKKQLVDEKREELRLEEFKPRVLTSFVRNKLIDEVYLPLIGDNLAKQMGVVGENKRTDLMGLLLLISPPGYGKTTLMEYVANRLGITFMKINGPAIGHRVTSLDPAEAPNASSREEVEKLNLSLEMGDNVMIYLDDIQHCNPEFLQKFISLCDATRRIEGVYKGHTRTYDLRGRKVCVVMAGNPYTESGEKFQIPDMLANRADTYNLGDVVGDNANSFELSYLENSLTSNPALNVLQSRSRNDVYAIIKTAEQNSPQNVALEGNYSIEEINELTDVMKKLIRIRNVLLKVNKMYIESAAQADEFRTEPAFKLQGSYRDMNKMAERVVAIMNDDELETLIMSHFENQAQTLTTGAEANLLKFKELVGTLEGEELARWEDIKRTFKRNLLLGGADADDKFGQVIAQMTTFSEGLHDIKKTIDGGVQAWLTREPEVEAAGVEQAQMSAHVDLAIQKLDQFQQSMEGIKEAISDGIKQMPQPSAVAATPASAPAEKLEIVNRVPRAFLEVIKAQFAIMAEWMEPVLKMTQNTSADAVKLREALQEALDRYSELMGRLHEYQQEAKPKKKAAKKAKKKPPEK